MERLGNIPPVVRKIIVSALVGLVTYFLTNVTPALQVPQLTLSILCGGLVMAVQVLAELDARVQEIGERQHQHEQMVNQLIEDGFRKINAATELFGLVEASAIRTDAVTQLVRNATAIGPGEPPLVTGFVQEDISRTAQFLKELAEGDVTYDGEDRDWLLALSHNTRSTIDATSLTTVDAGGRGFDGGFWMTDLGYRYLDVQRDLIRRDVRIRRVFILDRPQLAGDPDFLEMCRTQATMGIQVRILVPTTAPATRKSSLFDFVLFDRTISYEVTPAARVEDEARPTIVSTRLVARRARVDERIERFRDLWEAAVPAGLDARASEGPPA